MTLCETRPAATLWHSVKNNYRTNEWVGKYGVEVAVAETPTGSNTTAPPNYAPAEDETVTFAVTVTNYSDLGFPASQMCVRLAFTEGLTPPVKSQETAINSGVAIDPPRPSNPTSRQLRANLLKYYAAYGSYDAQGRGQSPQLDPRKLVVDADGEITENRRFRTLSRCSDHDGRFDGLIHYQGRTFQQAGIFHVGYTDAATAHTTDLAFTVPVPATARASGIQCILAEVSAQPAVYASGTPEDIFDQDNVAVACVGEPVGAEVPTLLQEGRADLITQHKCASGTKFFCAGKSADDLALYVNSATDAASDTGDAANGNGDAANGNGNGANGNGKSDAYNKQMAALYRQHVLKEEQPPVVQIQGLKGSGKKNTPVGVS